MQEKLLKMAMLSQDFSGCSNFGVIGQDIATSSNSAPFTNPLQSFTAAIRVECLFPLPLPKKLNHEVTSCPIAPLQLYSAIAPIYGL